jgi:hypothetical protein
MSLSRSTTNRSETASENNVDLSEVKKQLGKGMTPETVTEN